ncbi:MAG: alpha/beta hydrolase [Tissierellia bacterium]|nr:alpha/beta hydrolase [Tissierellia bacterium]
MEKFEVHKQILSNNEVMAYRKVGSGKEILLLIHGNQSSSIFYEDLMDTFKDKYTIYAIDLIGFGDSSYNREIQSIADFSVDVYLFMEALEIKSATVLGWSTGGGVAMELAALHPDKVKKLILMDSVGLKGYFIYKYDENFQPILSQRVYKKEDIAQDPVSVLPILKAFKERDFDFIKNVWNSIIFNLNQPDEEKYDILVNAIMKQRNLVDVVTSLAQFNITHENNGVVDGSGHIDLIQCPVYIIHGKEDLVVNVELAKEAARYFGDRGTLYILENAGHASFMDVPDEFEKILRSI